MIGRRALLVQRAQIDQLALAHQLPSISQGGAAKTLGLTVPQSLLLHADEVIQ